MEASHKRQALLEEEKRQVNFLLLTPLLCDCFTDIVYQAMVLLEQSQHRAAEHEVSISELRNYIAELERVLSLCFCISVVLSSPSVIL